MISEPCDQKDQIRLINKEVGHSSQDNRCVRIKLSDTAESCPEILEFRMKPIIRTQGARAKIHFIGRKIEWKKLKAN